MAKKRKHPKGLMVLFFTEMWERFGFYLILGILLLYMIEPTTTAFPGLGFSYVDASDILGTYLALVYLTPFIGGLLADRVLGYRLSISIGGILMGLGYLGLSVHNESIFYLSLLLIILGNGFFKPNISALVGKLYDDERDDDGNIVKQNPYKVNKDSGFNIFYMGINVGAFVCNFIAAYLRINHGWGWAFTAAGIGMFIGLIWFWSGQNYAKDIKTVDVIKPTKAEDMSLGKIFLLLLLPAFIAGAIGWFLPELIFGEPIFVKNSTDAFIFFSIPVLIFYINIYRKAGKADKEPVAALLAVFGIVIVFWAIFHQNATALTNWAENYTDRELPEWIAEPVETLNLNQVVSTEPDTILITDQHFVPILDKFGNKQYELGPDPYFKNIPELERPPEDQKVNLVSAELFQSINPGFIILLTPLVVGFFSFMRRRGKPLATPTKIALGLLITAMSALVMALAVYSTDNGLTKASALWLIGNYAIITTGELFLSPMGLSLVSKLSPQRFVALMMGGWFLSTSIGNKLSGVLAGMWDFYDYKAYFFITNSGLAMISVIGIFIMLPWLKRVVKQYTGSE